MAPANYTHVQVDEDREHMENLSPALGVFSWKLKILSNCTSQWKQIIWHIYLQRAVKHSHLVCQEVINICSKVLCLHVSPDLFFFFLPYVTLLVRPFLNFHLEHCFSLIHRHFLLCYLLILVYLAHSHKIASLNQRGSYLTTTPNHPLSLFWPIF